MKFLAILIAVSVELYVLQVQQWRQFSWFGRYTDSMLGVMKTLPFRESAVGVFLVILPILLVTITIQFGLEYQYTSNKVWVLLELFLSTIVLIYCMGPRDPIRMVDEYMSAMERTDVRAAQSQAEQLLGYIITEPVEEYSVRMKETLLLRVNENIVGPLFWFVLIGPVGAVLFRLGCELKLRYAHQPGGFATATQEFYQIITWLPARVCALGYAFAGSFVDTVSNWQKVSDLWLADSERFLIRSGLGAVGDVHHEDEEEQHALQSLANVLALVKRTVLVLIVLLAIMIIVGLINS